MILYKYCNQHGLDILRNSRLKLTKPSEFNDPFEFTPIIEDRLTLEELKSDTELQRTLWENWQQDRAKPASFAEFMHLVKSFSHSDFRRLADNQLQVLEGLAQGHSDWVGREFRVLCLSKRSDSILMWSHYADKHRGIVIGINVHHPEFPVLPHSLFDVRYSDKRFTIPAMWNLARLDWKKEKIAEQTFTTKYLHWKYEEEVRAIRHIADLHSEILPNGEMGNFLSIPKESIVAIRVGHRCPKEISDAVTNENPNVLISKTILNKDSFGLSFKSI